MKPWVLPRPLLCPLYLRLLPKVSAIVRISGLPILLSRHLFSLVTLYFYIKGSSKAPARVAQVIDDDDEDCFSEDGSKTNAPASPPATHIGEAPADVDAADALIGMRHEDAILPSSPMIGITGSIEGDLAPCRPGLRSSEFTASSSSFSDSEMATTSEGLRNVKQPPGQDGCSQDRPNRAASPRVDEISNFGSYSSFDLRSFPFVLLF